MFASEIAIRGGVEVALPRTHSPNSESIRHLKYHTDNNKVGSAGSFLHTHGGVYSEYSVSGSRGGIPIATLGVAT